MSLHILKLKEGKKCKMWIRVALDKESIHYYDPIGYSSIIENSNSEEYYFDEVIASALEADGFLTEMWEKLDALFDWGDCDFFPPDKCRIFKTWLEHRLQEDVNPLIKPIYEIMLDFAKKAILCDTGISFDF